MKTGQRFGTPDLSKLKVKAKSNKDTESKTKTKKSRQQTDEQEILGDFNLQKKLKTNQKKMRETIGGTSDKDDPVERQKHRRRLERKAIEEGWSKEKLERVLEKKGLLAVSPKEKTKKKKPLDIQEIVKEPGTDLVVKKGKKHELSIGDKQTVKGLSKLKRKGLRSIVAQDLDQVQQMIEVGDSDGAATMIYKRILQALLDAVPHMETMIHKTKGQRGSHQLQVLISSIREIMIDIQQAQDKGMLGEHLVEQVIRPSYVDLAMETMRALDELHRKIKLDVADPQQQDQWTTKVNAVQDRIGNFMSQEFQKVREQARSFLQR